jgi:arsenical pump membrane protein
VGATPLSRVRVLALIATACAGVAAVLDPESARAAAAQDWPPFVLVLGLLLVGFVADRDGVFDQAGGFVATRARSGWVLYAGAVVVIALVTAVLNLDTSVAFLTPVLIYTARRRGGGEGPLLYGCLLLSNAASLLLPGSNLTNLIVLGQLHLSGRAFIMRMAPAWVVAVLVTALVVGVAGRAELSHVRTQPHQTGPPPLRVGLAMLAIAASIVFIVVLRNPALPVVVVGLAAALFRLAQRRVARRDVLDVVGLPTLVALFGLAVTLGTLGRGWSGPAQLLGHLDRWGTAFVAAAVAVLVNNLPAASLLAARVPHHPFALLVGLNVGPNLCVTGSLAWLLWLRAARHAGARPSLLHASRLGLIATPLSIAGAVGALMLTATH